MFSHAVFVGCGRKIALQVPRRLRLRVEERDLPLGLLDCELKWRKHRFGIQRLAVLVSPLT